MTLQEAPLSAPSLPAPPLAVPSSTAPSLLAPAEVSSTPSSKAPRHVASLDGLRAVAVLAVMGHHFGFVTNTTGWLGVDVFFALSGFLITTLLCRELAGNGHIAFTKFWIRRFCRLMPAYWIYIGFVTIALLCTLGGYSAHDGWTPGWLLASLWGYFVNLAPAGLWTKQIFTFHLWSLALEEQFYFCWPVVFGLIAARSNRFLIAALPFALLCVLLVLPASHPSTARQSYVRGVGILAGCAVALYLYDTPDKPLRNLITRSGPRALLLVALIVCVAALELYLRRGGSAREPILRAAAQKYFVPPFVLLCAVFIASLWYGREDLLTRALSLRPLAYLGKISYGMYLYHMACLVFVRAAVQYLALHRGIHVRFYVAAPVFIASVIAVASLSFWLIERPFLQLKDRFRPSTRA